MSAIQFAASGTPAQVLAAIDAAIFNQQHQAAWERLGIVGVTGVDLPRGIRFDFLGSLASRTIDAPDKIPVGKMMQNGHSAFWLRD